MKIPVFGLSAMAASAALATAAFGAADPNQANPPAPPAAQAPAAQPAPPATPAAQTPPAQTPPPAAPAANGGSGGEAPLTRAQILEQGEKALLATCDGVCHLSDKWESASRDRDGWANAVNDMVGRMRDAEMPTPNARTYNLVVDYLALTRPQ